MKIKTKQRLRKPRLFLLIVALSMVLLPVSCAKKKANEKVKIILISVDTLRGDHLSSAGYFRDTTPNLSKLIEDSAYYTHAYTNGCWTVPAHMSLLTGTLPSKHGINSDWASVHDYKKFPKLNQTIINIAESLKQHNKDIKTVKFAALPKELGFGNGFEKDHRIDPFGDSKNFNKLLKALEENKEKDFFFFIHTWMVHAPYSNCHFLGDEKIAKEQRDYINNFRKAVKNEGRLTHAFMKYLKEINLFNINDCIILYDSGIHYVDRFMGELINKCRQLGIYEDLLIIVTADHGEHFNEHSRNRFYNYHGKEFYEEFIKVPLIIKYPREYKTGKIDRPVSLIDVFPTVLDFFDIRYPNFIQGESLLTPQRKRKIKYIVSEAISESESEKKMLRVGNLKYIITMDKPAKPERVNWDLIVRRKLFDLENDPLEKNNLYKDLKFRGISIALEKMLLKIITKSSRVNRSGGEVGISQETLDQMKALGYL